MKHPQEFTKLWNAPIAGIELFEAHIFQHRFSKHFHEAYTIGFNYRGHGQCFHQRKTHQHSPGSFNCINPGEVHTGEAASVEGWAFKNFYITPAALRETLQQLGHSPQVLPYFSEIIVNDEPLQVLFCQLFNALNSPTSKLTQQTHLLQFFSRILSKHITIDSRPKPEKQTMSRVCRYLEEHCSENVSIEEIARLVHLNPYYLIRCFRQQVGTPPHQYKKHCQLKRAKQALRTKQSLTAIALSCGFYDQSHFTRAFKRTFGISPGQYRQVNFIQSDERSTYVG